MADEARMYLEKLNAAPPTKEGSRASSHTPSDEIEVIPDDDLQRRQTKGAPSSPLTPQLAPPLIQDDTAGSQPVPVQREIPNETQAPPPKKAPVSTDGAAPAQGGIAEGSGPQSYKYIVQIGSFVDREKAEEIKKSLNAKGYSAFVRPLNHRVLGKVFVIRLQPVSSVSSATTLSTQLKGEIEGEPVIIKMPARLQTEITKPPARQQGKPRPGDSDNRANPGKASNLHSSRSTPDPDRGNLSQSVGDDALAPSEKIPPSKSVAKTPEGKILPSRQHEAGSGNQ
jgi:cell division septation protein DedD